jgi:hypothetical protein
MKLYRNYAAALAIGASLLLNPVSATHGSAAVPQDYTVTFSVNGEAKGNASPFELGSEIDVRLQGNIEIGSLRDALLGHKVLDCNRTVCKEIWLDRMEIIGETLVIRGGGRFEDRLPLPFGGWTKVFSQSGSIEVHAQLAAVNGQPQVRITKVNFDLGGLLGDVVRLFNIDGMLEKAVRPVIQAKINEEVAKHIPQANGTVTALNVETLRFVNVNGGFGIATDIKAKIKLG